VLVATLPGNAPRTPWGGGGDTETYLLLAHNLVEGKGYAYAGMPTALRAPVYPLLLASFLKIFGSHALMAVRCLQFLEGLAVVLLCAALARRLVGETAGKCALLFALFAPTLADMNGEILTEAPATLFATIFLCLLAEYLLQPRWIVLFGLGWVVGLGALTRFNMALLGVVVLCVVVLRKGGLPRWQGAAVTVLLPLILISPWLIRNFVVFHGAALFSTHAGMDALQGVLVPQARALPGDAEKLRAEVGWVPPVDIETNSPARLRLPAEPVLDRQCSIATRKVWRRIGWGLIPIEVKKLSYFWLSTDQLLWTGSFRPRERVERAIGVLVYWAILAVALFGWVQLRARNVQLARTFLFYAALVTVMHLPFNMNTRYRMPFIDPLLVVLAGIGMAAVVSRVQLKNGAILQNSVLE
jgi:4-amino-4-deoxy-L-arabinose transferase-like glycosyltransferase